MEIITKLNEKMDRLDELNEVVEEWYEIYKNGVNFQRNQEWNSNSYKLSIIQEAVNEMCVLAEQIEMFEVVIEELEK